MTRALLALDARRRLLAAALSFGLLIAGAALTAPSARAQSGALPDFTGLVEQVGPAVVNIRTLERVRAGARNGVPEMDEDMLEFFSRTRAGRAAGRATASRSSAASARASSSAATAT
jgi:serine protease Do